MKNIINREQPFQVLATNFSIGPSSSGYELEISADGVNYTSLFTVGANVTRMVTGVANGSYYRLAGNTDEDVVVNWRTQCNDGGEGGGGGTGPQGPQGPQGPAGGGGDSAQTMALISAAINANNENLEEGDPIVGMAKQLYSPNGTTSDGTFAYRTTAGDADVTSGPANLMKVMGNATYPQTEYNDSAVLMREGSEVEGFDADFAWGDTATYVEWNTLSGLTVAERAELGYKVIRANNDISGYGKIRFLSSTSAAPNVYVGLDMEYNNGVWAKATSNVEVVEENRWIWKHPDNASIIIGDVYYENGWLYVTINNPSIIARWSNLSLTGFNATNIQLVEGTNIPNDIPYGESTYTYDGSDWTPSLPQAVTAMTLNSETYSPESGDEIVINRSLSKTGSASYPQPYSFVALGLNSFSKDGSPINTIEQDEYKIEVINDGANYNLTADSDYAVYAIKAVTGLSNGYVVYHKSGSSISWAGVYDPEETDMVFSATIRTDNYDVVFPTAEFPYIVFSARKDEEGMICVHPRWSGYMDEEYEDYSESVLDIYSFNALCPLVSVGTTKNVWDFENQQLVQNISVSNYSAQAVQDLIDGGKELGTDFDFDEYHIYEVLDESISIPIEFNNEYEANDFSVEYFTDVNDSDLSAEAADVETYYMQNLVDKLRRMENNFIHLTSLDGAGETGKTYEYNGRLMRWVEGSGYTAEWLTSIDQIRQSGNEGTGLIYANIPDGQVLFEFRNNNSGDYRKVVYSGNTLYLTETAGTVVCAVTVGNTFKFEATNYGNIRNIEGIFQNGYIGFRIGSYGSLQMQNVWNGSVNGGHYELIDKYNYPYTLAGNGIPQWNDKGQVTKLIQSISTKNYYFNATGTSTSNRTTVITTGTNNGPDHLFGPTDGGTQGQILLSNGNAAPVWSDWIKAVKITSDAYEALAVKDPNTLYLIDDEV